MNIESIDLNLLIALKALLDEKHVTRAAERAGISQPAMSRALAKLRHILKDPLLVRSGSGLALTTRANELAQPLQTIFTEVNNVISPPSADPASMQGEVIIATRDYEMEIILPGVMQHIAQEAPGLTVRIIRLSGDDLSLLERQEADFIICAAESKSATLYRQTLYKDDFVCLASAKNPLAKKNITLKNYVKMKHCLVTIAGYGPGLVDTLLLKQGLKREIAIRVPHFFTAASIVAKTDLIVTLPRKLGTILAQQNDIVMIEPPLKIPHFSIYSYWHVRNQNNPLHKWFRELIRNVSAQTTR